MVDLLYASASARLPACLLWIEPNVIQGYRCRCIDRLYTIHAAALECIIDMAFVFDPSNEIIYA